jgi:transposase
MLTGMTERDWLITLEVFDAVQSSRGEPGHDDREFLEAIHYFTVHSITWRALPAAFGNWTAYGNGAGSSADLAYSRHSFRFLQNAARPRI